MHVRPEVDEMGDLQYYPEKDEGDVLELKMLNPRLIKYLIGEVIERQRRRYYLKEV